LGGAKNEMTIFEYLSVAVSILLSLAAVRLITGLPHVAASPQRYWVHLVYVLLVAVQTVLIWWNSWAYRQVEDWVLPGFVLFLLMPATLYFIASTLVPDAPATVSSWKVHFFRVRARFFLAYVFLFLLFSLSTFFLLDVPLLHPQRAVHLIGVGTFAVGAASTSERIHAFLAWWCSGVLAIAIAGFFLRPGGIAPS